MYAGEPVQCNAVLLFLTKMYIQRAVITNGKRLARIVSERRGAIKEMQLENLNFVFPFRHKNSK